MGVVYEAMHMRLQQRLAIKVLRPGASDADESLARFEREARATAQLRSVHAAHVVDAGTLPNGLPYIVMEFLEGRDLDAELEATGPMPVDDAVDIVEQVAEAMAEAHALGIVHRDLKPSNLFVSRVGGRRFVKVLDFGISKIEGDSRITGSEVYFGTPCYAAPEQLRAACNADARSDVWSLGVILFELLTGRTPFGGPSVAVIVKVATDPLPSPLDLRPDLPLDLVQVLMGALRRDPQERFQSMRELARALAPFGSAARASTSRPNPGAGCRQLGEILVSEGLVDPLDLERALAEQRNTGKLLGRVLVDLRLIARADLLTVLAKQQGLAAVGPVADPTDRDSRASQAPTLRSRAVPAPPVRSGSTWRWVLGAIVVLVAGALAVRAAWP
jgi:serine/threonine protein kinase